MMKRLFMIVFILSLCFISCSKKEEKIPSGIIAKDTMVLVMVDIHLAEAQAQFNSAFDNKGSVKQEYYKFIFRKHKINADMLMKSWAFYASHPEILSRMYEDIITELSKKQAEATKVIKPVPENTNK